MVFKKQDDEEAAAEYGYGYEDDVGDHNRGLLGFDAYNGEFADPALHSREESMSVRVRRRGLRLQHTSSSVASANFAVQSVRRGTHDWGRVLKLFVADLAFRSVVQKPFQREVTFRPYTCHAAVLFVDLSGYSRIASVLAHKGAHYLSCVVNAYFSRILKIVSRHGGDVVKFAGDAVIVVWEGQEQALENNFFCAALCALELQEKAPLHTVLEAVGSTPALGFQIHCGITCGILESEVFVAPVHEKMQRLFHAIGGEALEVIGDIVDAAKAGEVAIDENCLQYLASRGTTKKATGCDQVRILVSIDIDPSLVEQLEIHVEAMVADRELVRTRQIEEGFIHPRVIQQLSHGGHSPTQIAQMRCLCVLFIAQTSHGCTVTWLMEVQEVLDMMHCPIVQIIEDDKGVHIVAAVNLYETVPEVSILGIKVCRALEDRKVGCAIGMALGTTFCGVTGSSSIACRWDITGPAVVRAARLMQFAQSNHLHAAVDHSVYCDQNAAFFLTQCYCDINLKGSAQPCNVYRLKGNMLHSAFRILDTMHGRAHPRAVAEIADWIRGGQCKSAVVVVGPTLAGKKVVCQQAAGLANFVPYIHICDSTWGNLQLARTIATWFTYVESKKVSSAAREVLDHMDKNRWSCAHDSCFLLMQTAIQEGLRACFIVDRIQFLDDFSMSLIRIWINGRCDARRDGGLGAKSLTRRSFGIPISSSEESGSGKICFLCVHVSFYGKKCPEDIVQEIAKSKTFRVPIVEVGVASDEQLRTMIRDISDMEVEDRWLRTFAETSGNCAGYLTQRAAASRCLSVKLWKEGKPGLAVTTEELVLSIPPGYIRKNREIKVISIAGAAMRFAHIYDELPPLFQTLSKVIAIGTRKGFCGLSRTLLFEVLNDLIAEGVDESTMTMVLDEMKTMYLLKIVESETDEEIVSFLNPALGDTAMDVCTPSQVKHIANALIDRLEPIESTDFRIPLLLADMHLQLGKDEDLQKLLWYKGYQAFLQESEAWSAKRADQWKEIIEDEIEEAGYDVHDVLGDDFTSNTLVQKPVITKLPMLKIYSAPIAFGPMGHSLCVITRNTFHEHRVFHGATNDEIKEILASRNSAANRYSREIGIVEAFLSDHSIDAPSDHLEREREIITYISKPASNDQEVVAKAVRILDEYVPLYVKPRLERLRALVSKLRERGLPSVMENAEKAIRMAYEQLLSSSESEEDTAQHALMIMATLNWKPKLVPEYLSVYQYQTIPNIRTSVLRGTRAEAVSSSHPQMVKDFEAFLVVTSLLHAGQESSKY